MKPKYLLLIVLVAIVIVALVGLKMYFKPHADINKLEADYTIDAITLINEFQENEEVASSKYNEKVLEISGSLASNSKLSNGTTLLILEDEMEGISCQLDSNWVASNQEVIESLEPGNPVTVKGVCKGYLMEIKVSPAVVVN